MPHKQGIKVVASSFRVLVCSVLECKRSRISFIVWLCLNTFFHSNVIHLIFISQTLHFPFNFQHMSVNKLSETLMNSSFAYVFNQRPQSSYILFVSVCCFLCTLQHFAFFFSSFCLKFRFYDLIQICTE